MEHEATVALVEVLETGALVRLSKEWASLPPAERDDRLARTLERGLGTLASIAANAPTPLTASNLV